MKNALHWRVAPLVGAAALAAGAYVWLLLRVILSVPIWVSFLAAAGAIAACVAAALALAARAETAETAPRRGDAVGDESVRLNPLVNVRSLRMRFAGALVLTLFSGWLLIETLAFSTATQRAISFASGIAITALAVCAYVGYRRRPLDAKQSVVVPSLRYRFMPAQAVSAVAAALGAWQIVATRVFSAEHARWLTFENGCVMLALGLALLIVHEFSSERIVHVLELAGWTSDHAGRERSPRSPLAA